MGGIGDWFSAGGLIPAALNRGGGSGTTSSSPTPLTPQEIATRNASLDRNRQALVAALLPWQQGLMPAVSRQPTAPRQPVPGERNPPGGAISLPSLQEPRTDPVMREQPLRGISTGPFAGGGLSSPLSVGRPWETLVRNRRAIA